MDPSAENTAADVSGPPNPRPRFSIVVPTLGRSAALESCLACIRRLDPAPYEVVVVDGSTENDPPQGVDDVVYLRSAPGLTRQRNAALGFVTGDVVLFLDDDAEIPPDALHHLARAYSDRSVIGATGRIIESSGERLVGKESPLRRLLFGGGKEGGFTSFGYPRRAFDPATPQDISFMQGCFMSARKEAARVVGFDENLAGYGLAEDEDFSYRLSRIGRIRYVPEIEVHHANLGFLTKDESAFGRQVVVNRAYLFKKNFPQTPAARVRFGLFLLVLVIHRLVNRERQGLRGVVDGIMALRASAVTTPTVTFVSSHARHGGSERYLTTLLSALGPGWVGKVIVLEEGPLVQELHALGSRVDVIPVSGAPSHLIRAIRPLRQAVKEHRADVVHANGIKAALLASLACAGTRLPVVWVKHDFSWDGPVAWLVSLLCKQVVGVSRAVVETLPAWTSRKVSVVPIALKVPHVRRDRARTELRQRLNLPESVQLVAHVGRMHPVKGHGALVTALGSAPLIDDQVHVVMAGGRDPSHPSFEADLRALIE
ncbi:MAG: glycosyltransferase, partial [Actinomycetota bacterium]|nr:glycosyltransferase [Actinomycetota bacterium]